MIIFHSTTTARNGHGVNFEFNEHDDVYTLAGGGNSMKNSPQRRNSGNSSMLDTASVLTQGGSVVTVKATISKGILTYNIDLGLKFAYKSKK